MEKDFVCQDDFDPTKSGGMPLLVVGCEFDSEHIPHSLLRG